MNNLYIPHGSDNTKLETKIAHGTGSFISHMVQIIPFHFYYLLSFKIKNFISHMVQIIHFRAFAKINPNPISLYPTWFR